jgi:hypothetical protein
LWAHQTQSDARNQQRNFYFEGATIYSYGAHFPIARHVQRGRKHCVLFTTRGHSSTTSGHIACVWEALGLSFWRGMYAPDQPAMATCGRNPFPIFRVPDTCFDDPRVNLESYRQRINEVAGKLHRARKNRDGYLREFAGLIDEANRYAAFFGLRTRIKIADTEAYAKEYAAKQDAINRKEREAQKRAQAQRDAELVERVARWRAGENVDLYGYSTVLLRVRHDQTILKNEDKIETSIGAIVPLEHAKRLFKFIADCRRRGASYTRNGHTIRIGHYALDSIDSAGNIKTGCHRIMWPEIERLARELGVFTETPELSTAELKALEAGDTTGFDSAGVNGAVSWN